ncbi:hypothetical protein [Deinococcus koreensis]|uniref:Uncharacterized protein n=1 Tax=Deinococcus koreensis TaxID=2054903 RepID=A0A2K3V1T5_9DEIO|nr:hypothetical protein [Deinococcus koreensis]PNY82746.1 hypothetical protein CVO96_16540 [Deinococcus koreensis]
MSDHTTIDEQVFWLVAVRCALSSRTLTAHGCPRRSLSALISRGWLLKRETDFGPVVALTAAGLAEARRRRPREAFDRLSAPSMLAGRAYLNDTLDLLAQTGYTTYEAHYKRALAGKSILHSHQITSVTVEVDPVHLTRLRAFHPVRSPENLEPIGRPRLYIFPSGISVARLRQLLTVHARDIPAWRHPLLIAAPNDHAVRALLRAAQARQKRAAEQAVGAVTTADVQLIIVRS